jgi:signal recognition particle receptor subunit beta
MVSINYAFREISCKIVFYGPGLSGKTTNLQYVHQKVPGKTKGELISLATDADRTLYFDFLPINLGAIQGFATKFQLYTVPGQVYYNATRKLVLRGVDGVVFVADSQRAKLDENIESLKNLYDNLQEYGYDAEDLPLVIQYNKRDLPDVMTIPELQAALNPQNRPTFEASAVNGTGVFDTLKMIIKLVLDKARKRSELASQASGSATVQAATTMAQAAAPVAQAAAPITQAAAPRPIPAVASSMRPRELDDEPVAAATMSQAHAVSSRALAMEYGSTPAGLATRPEPLSSSPSGVMTETARPAAKRAASPAESKASVSARPITMAPSVIPKAPSLKRSSEPRKKRSFWRKLFSWI